MNKRYSNRTLWQWLPALFLLLLFTSLSHAATTITSLTSSPTTVAPGEEVFHSISATTDAVEVLTGSASFTLSRDGSPVFSDTAQDFLDQQDIGGGGFQDTFSFPPALYSTPGEYQLLVEISGTEDFEIQVSDSATTTFTVAAPIVATVVSPTSLSLSGNPGETVSGTFTVTDGESPFSLAALQGSLSQTSANVGESISYSFLIPADATPGSQLSDDITVTPVAGDPVIIPVSISVVQPDVQPITVSPPSLSLEGGAGETPTASFMITAGLPPFQLSSANPEERGSFSNPAPGLNESVDYGFRIPGGATNNQVFTDTITVIGSDGEQATVIATITAVAGDGGSPIEGVLQDFVTSDTQKATASVIEIVCPSGAAAGTQFQNDCDAVVGAALSGDPAAGAQVAQALAQITTDQASASIDVSQTSIQGQIRNVGTRIAALRSGAVGFSSRGLSFNLDGQHIPAGDLADALLKDLQGARGGAAGSDNLLDFGRLGVFVNGSVSRADRDATANAAGFDSDTVSLTLGADYRFRDNMVAGAALGYSSSDTNIDSNGGSLDADGYSLSLYGTYFQDSGLYIDGIVTYGKSDYDQRRNIRYTLGTTAIDQTASADFDGSELSASLGGGYMFSKGALSFGPTARIEYIRTEVDGFSERMSNPTASGGGWATRIESQDFTSVTSQLGGQVSYAVSTSWGVLLPTAQLEWVHEFEDNAGNVVGHFLQDTSGTTFSLATDDLDQNYFNLNLGVSAQFAQGRTGYVNFRKLFGYDDLDVYTVSAGVRLEF